MSSPQFPSSSSQTSPLDASSKIHIRPVTSEVDVPVLAGIADTALKPDSFYEFRARYSSQTMYDNTVDKLTNALRENRGRYFLFKAVLDAESGSQECPNGENIVGWALWRLGYVETPKMDPFAPKKQSAAPQTGVTDVAVPDSPDPDPDCGQAAGATAVEDRKFVESTAAATASKPFYSNPDAEVARKLGNLYITNIRGKKHVYLHCLVVHPSYQRLGIGQKLLNWGIETADRENVVAWLNSRPAGSRLYERNGWKIVGITEFETPDRDLQVAPAISMLRLPRRQSGG